jgi:hypothetical protein
VITAAVVAPLVLAAVLAFAALSKVRHPDSVLSSMRLLKLPAPLIKRPLAQAFPWAELVLAGGLLLAPAGWPFTVVGVATALLFFTYWGLIARGLTMTPRPSCGCFGTIGQPIRPATLVRNTVLLLLAAVVLATALAGESSLSLAADLDRGDWWWLLASAATAAAAGLVIDSERPRHPALQQPPPSQPTPQAATSDEVPGEDGLLDYERSPIPSQLLIDADGDPVPLRRLAAQQAQLLLWVTCGCGRSHTIVEKAAQWREAMPQIDVRLVSSMAPESTKQTFESYGEEFLHDPDQTTFVALGFRSDPGAVLLGADGLLAGGPVAGLEEVQEFVDDIVEALADADAPTS